MIVKRSMAIAVILFALFAIIAGITGGAIIQEFAMATQAHTVARPSELTCIVMIVAALGAVVLPIIALLLGVIRQISPRNE
jgi:hypothetical protein